MAPPPDFLKPFLNAQTAKNRAGLAPCATATLQFAQRNSCTLRNRSRSTGISGHDHRNTQIRIGEFIIKLDKVGDDLFSMVADEYLIQLNREIQEIHSQMKAHDLVKIKPIK